MLLPQLLSPAGALKMLALMQKVDNEVGFPILPQGLRILEGGGSQLGGSLGALWISGSVWRHFWLS